MYFAFARCFKGHVDMHLLAVPKLKERLEECNTRYPDGIAAAFRALRPDFGARGPEQLASRRNPRLTDEEVSWSMAYLLNDEFAAAVSFRHWLNMYISGQCLLYARRDLKTPRGAGILARLLHFIRYGNPARATEGTGPENGTLQFEQHAGGVFGGTCTLGNLGRFRLPEPPEEKRKK
jgi:hypothetical protein